MPSQSPWYIIENDDGKFVVEILFGAKHNESFIVCDSEDDARVIADAGILWNMKPETGKCNPARFKKCLVMLEKYRWGVNESILGRRINDLMEKAENHFNKWA